MSNKPTNQNRLKVEWTDLRGVVTRPTLAELCDNPRHLFENYYEIATSTYAFASHQWDPVFSEQATFVLAVFWAPTFMAFHRMISRDPHIVLQDDGAVAPLPEGLRLAPYCVDYQSISQFISTSGNQRQEAVDLYDHNWNPIGCGLSVERLTYHFRSSRPVPPQELPSGVKLVTSDERWKPIGR